MLAETLVSSESKARNTIYLTKAVLLNISFGDFVAADTIVTIVCQRCSVDLIGLVSRLAQICPVNFCVAPWMVKCEFGQGRHSE